jgi:hypothetical protein
LHNKEIHNLYFSPNSARVISAGHVAYNGDEKCIQSLFRKPEGRPSHTCGDNIKMDLKRKA